ncbi:hypothetical protein [Kutzneria sp. NPDC052558]|uniref:hypothetical protein n=1 Tax=Kutzneria sp. NPDC052558 TaxID=3364121 RepID=UPI0037C88337
MNRVVVDLAQLGRPGELIGSGGQAKVYRLPGVTLPDVPHPLVYKQYRPGQAPPHGLHAIVARRYRLDHRTRARLDRATAWPVRVVEDGGTVSGVVMPLIGDDFFQRRTLPSGSPTRTLREVQHLFVDPARSQRLGMPSASMRDRVLICRDFASIVHLLHRNDMVIGDLNAKNAVFRFGVRPTVLLVDCDAIRIRGAMAVVRQLNAPDWDPPERDLSQATDRYKFGLFVLRCLAPGPQASVTRDVGRLADRLDPYGRRLLTDSLGSAPGARPTMQTWGRYFDQLLSGRPPGPTTSTDGPPQPAPGPVESTTGWSRDPVTGRWKPS